jgi:hypothetical protein
MHEYGSLPRAREDGLLEEAIGEELLLYDLESHTAHCLTPIAASVWRHCDGEHDVTKLAQLAGADESLVAEALHELRERKLLNAEPELMQSESAVSGVSRREAIVRVARYGAAAAAGSMIVSATAATPAMASSGEGEGKIQTLPEITSLKFKGKVSHIITIMNIGSGNVKFIKEFTSFEEAYKITKKCPENAEKEIILEPGHSCEVTIEHTNTTKGQSATWWLEWNGGGFNEKNHVTLESE